jgi:hypothetical protein
MKRHLPPVSRSHGEAAKRMLNPVRGVGAQTRQGMGVQVLIHGWMPGPLEVHHAVVRRRYSLQAD